MSDQFRKCFYCPEIVDATDKPWIVACYNCYQCNVRKCPCGRNLKLGAQSYQVECTQCWLAKRAVTHTTCPTCPETRSSFLSVRLGKETICAICAKSYVANGASSEMKIHPQNPYLPL